MPKQYCIYLKTLFADFDDNLSSRNVDSIPLKQAIAEKLRALWDKGSEILILYPNPNRTSYVEDCELLNQILARAGLGLEEIKKLKALFIDILLDSFRHQVVANDAKAISTWYASTGFVTISSDTKKVEKTAFEGANQLPPEITDIYVYSGSSSACKEILELEFEYKEADKTLHVCQIDKTSPYFLGNEKEFDDPQFKHLIKIANAVDNGDLLRLKNLLAQCSQVDLNSITLEDDLPLLQAALQDHYAEIAELLIQHGAKLTQSASKIISVYNVQKPIVDLIRKHNLAYPSNTNANKDLDHQNAYRPPVLTPLPSTSSEADQASVVLTPPNHKPV